MQTPKCQSEGTNISLSLRQPSILQGHSADSPSICCSLGFQVLLTKRLCICLSKLLLSLCWLIPPACWRKPPAVLLLVKLQISYRCTLAHLPENQRCYTTLAHSLSPFTYKDIFKLKIKTKTNLFILAV